MVALLNVVEGIQKSWLIALWKQEDLDIFSKKDKEKLRRAAMKLSNVLKLPERALELGLKIGGARDLKNTKAALATIQMSYIFIIPLKDYIL